MAYPVLNTPKSLWDMIEWNNTPPRTPDLLSIYPATSDNELFSPTSSTSNISESDTDQSLISSSSSSVNSEEYFYDLHSNVYLGQLDWESIIDDINSSTKDFFASLNQQNNYTVPPKVDSPLDFPEALEVPVVTSEKIPHHSTPSLSSSSDEIIAAPPRKVRSKRVIVEPDEEPPRLKRTRSSTQSSFQRLFGISIDSTNAKSTLVTALKSLSSVRIARNDLPLHNLTELAKRLLLLGIAHNNTNPLLDNHQIVLYTLEEILSTVEALPKNAGNAAIGRLALLKVSSDICKQCDDKLNDFPKITKLIERKKPHQPDLRTNRRDVSNITRPLQQAIFDNLAQLV